MPSQRGTATIEFALIAPLLLLLLAGVLDYSMLMRTAIAVADAARAGALYGSLSPASATDLAGMKTAALNAAPDIAGLTGSQVTAVTACQCSDGSTVTCGSGTCASGAVRIYAQVTIQVACSPIFSYSQLPFSGTVTSKASMRAQ